MGEYLFRPDATKAHKCELPMDQRKLWTPPNRDGTRNNSFTMIKETPALGSVWRCECGRLWEVRMITYAQSCYNKRNWTYPRWRTSYKYAIRNNK